MPPPDGPVTSGVCKICFTSRDFHNSNGNEVGYYGRKKVKKSTQSLKKSGTRKSEKAELTITLQESFLVAFGEVGSIRKACTASSVGRSTVEDWMRNDVNSFKAKMDAARQIFREMLQDMALERAQAQKPNDNLCC